MSTQRAFVIQFLQRAGAEEGFSGRVEHVGSGEVTHFTTPDELIRFLEHHKGSTTQTPAQPRAEAAAASAPAAPRLRRSPS